MAQCKLCEKVKECKYLEHLSNEHLNKESYHNCQEFDGEQAGYRIYRVGGEWPEGEQVVKRVS